MRRSDQLSKTDGCKSGSSVNITSTSPGMLRAGAAKAVTKRLLLGEPIPDVKAEIASLLHARGYKWENDTQKEENLGLYEKKIRTYIDGFESYRQDSRYYIPQDMDTTVDVFGETVDAKCDFLIDDGMGDVVICKLSTGKPKAFDPYNMEDYAMGLLGEKLFPGRNIIVEHLGLSINTGSDISAIERNQNNPYYMESTFSSRFEFSDSVKQMYESANEELNSEDHVCSPESCASCGKFNICNYKEPPVALEESSLIRPVDEATLTNEQRRVIDYEYGNARVNAPAGSGKTLVVAMRVAELLSKGYRPEDICLLTFTRAGAQEMTMRAMSYAAARGQALDPEHFTSGTINGFCQNIVAQHYEELGFSRPPRIVPDQIKYATIQDVIGNKLPKVSAWNYNFCQDMKRFNPYQKNIAINEAVKVFDQIRATGKSRAELLDLDYFRYNSRHFTEDDLDIIYAAYELYNQQLKERNLCEFDDQLKYVMQLSDMHPDLFENMGYKHIIIDEFQDTDLKQIKLLNRMSDTTCFRSLMAVGDDSQSIFGFRFTSPEYMINFEQYFGQFDDFNLEYNFRSNKATIDLANSINDLANEKVNKSMIPTKEQGIIPRIHGSYSEKEEYKFIVEDIKRHIEDGKTDIAVLAATKAELSKIADMLTQEGIASTMMCGTPVMENSRVAALITFYDSFFKNTTQGLADYQNVLNHGAYKDLPPETIEVQVDTFKTSLAELPRNLDNFMEFAKALDEEGIDGCYQDFLEQLDFCETTEELKEFMDAFKLYGDKAEYVKKGRYEGVALNTIHSSKGLEWDTTYLTLSGMDKKMKHSSSYHRSKEHDEDIRKWFVGCTRAKSELVVTGQYLLEKPSVKNGAIFNQFLQKSCELVGRSFDYNYGNYVSTTLAEKAEAQENAKDLASKFSLEHLPPTQSTLAKFVKRQEEVKEKKEKKNKEKQQEGVEKE